MLRDLDPRPFRHHRYHHPHHYHNAVITTVTTSSTKLLLLTVIKARTRISERPVLYLSTLTLSRVPGTDQSDVQSAEEPSSETTQTFQNSLIKEYTLNYSRFRNMR